MSTSAEEVAEQVAERWWLYSPELFAQRWAPEVAGYHFQSARHIVYVAEKVAARILDGGARIIISMPPRHGKSEFLTFWLVLWLIVIWSNVRIGLISYSDRLIRRNGRRIRNALRSHGPLWGVQLSEDSQAKDEFTTTGGAEFAASTVRGQVTGFGFDVLLLDDLCKNAQEAYSPTYQESIWDQWSADISTRLQPGGSVVMLMTRWHELDLPGQILRQARETGEQWEVINLPAIAEADDPLERAPGEALWPAMFPVKVLETFKKRAAWVWNALFQGKPDPATAASPVNGDDIVRWDPKTLPPLKEMHIIQSWDPSHEGADPTSRKPSDKRSKVGGVTLGLHGGRVYVLDHVLEHLDFDATEHAMCRMTERWPRTRRIFVERTANGPGLIGRLLVRLPELLGGRVPVVQGLKPEGSKYMRLASVAGYFKSHQVVFPPEDTHAWAEDLIERLLHFPSVEWDDDIDALSQALAESWLPEEDSEEQESQTAADEWAELLGRT